MEAAHRSVGERPDSPTPLSSFTPQAIRQITIPANVRAAMTAGFAGVTADPKGTAYASFQGFPLDTDSGLGQDGHRAGRARADGKGDTSLFAAYFPANAPQYVVVAVVEEGGRGAKTAAPIVRRVIEAISGLPTGAPVQALATGKD